MNFRLKILSIIFPAIVILTSALGFISYVYLKKLHLDEWDFRVDLTLNDHLMNFEKRKVVLSEAHGKHEPPDEVLSFLQSKSEKLSDKNVINEFKFYEALDPSVYAYRILSGDGSQVIGYNGLSGDYVEGGGAKSQYVDKIMNNIEDISTALFFDDVMDELSLIVSRRINSDSHSDGGIQTIGYVLLSVHLDFLQKLIDSDYFVKGGGLVVIDNVGQALMSPQRNVSNLFSNENKSLLDYRISDDYIEGVSKSIRSHSLEFVRSDNSEAYVKSIELDENIYLMSWVPYESMSEEVNLIATHVVLMVLAVTLVMCCLVYMVLNYDVGSTAIKLSKIIDAIKTGKVEIDIKQLRDHDISVLGEGLDNIIRKVSPAHDFTVSKSYYDPMKGMPTNEVLKTFLTKCMAMAERQNEMLAVLVMNVDDFKGITDVIGHEAGRRLISQLSSRIGSIVRTADFVSHLDPAHLQSSMDDVSDIVGRDRLLLRETELFSIHDKLVSKSEDDEFVILLPNIVDEYDACIVARRLINNVKKTFLIGDREVNLSTSVGIAVYPTDSVKPDALIANARIAMQHAKDMRQGSYKYYSDTLNFNVIRREKFEDKIKCALDDDKFYLVYQPQIDLSSGNIVALEALIRWEDDEDGMIPPDKFIPVAEDCGLINAIGEWVLNKACCQAKKWLDLNCCSTKVAVNVSSIQLSNDSFLSTVQNALDRANLPAAFLEIEITESYFIDNSMHVTGVLEKIRSLGVGVSLDDFGTGYSSLSYLRRLPIDILKIDRSFVDEIGVQTASEAILLSIISMAHALNLKVVAEGVETQNQLDFLDESGCDLIQGYFLFKPMRVDDVTDLLKKNFALERKLDSRQQGPK